MKNVIHNTTNIEFSCNIEGVEFYVLFLEYPLQKDEFSNLETAEGERPRHIHNYYEIIFFDDDSAVRFETKNENFLLKRGDVVLVSPECEHLFHGIENAKAYKVGFTINQHKQSGGRALKYLISWLKSTEYDVLSGAEEVRAMICALSKSVGRLGAYYRMSACFTNLIFYLLESFSQKNGESFIVDDGLIMEREYEDIIANALMFHYATEIRAEDVAAQIFLSARQVNRICHKIYGRSFRAQKEFFRIEIAKKLLAKTAKNILDISLECGFNSLGSFYLAFRKLENTSPNEYRLAHQK